MVYGFNPFQDALNVFDLKKKIDTRVIRYPSTVKIKKGVSVFKVSDYCVRLLKGLLQKNQILRLTWVEFFDHVWLREEPKLTIINSKLDFQRDSGKEQRDEINIDIEQQEIPSREIPVSRSREIPQQTAENIATSPLFNYIDNYMPPNVRMAKSEPVNTNGTSQFYYEVTKDCQDSYYVEGLEFDASICHPTTNDPRDDNQEQESFKDSVFGYMRASFDLISSTLNFNSHTNF